MEQRRAEFGENKLPESRHETLFQIFLHQSQDPLIYILLIVGTERSA
ncbi:cation-transporting P-type ATPase [Chelativorans salis]